MSGENLPYIPQNRDLTAPSSHATPACTPSTILTLLPSSSLNSSTQASLTISFIPAIPAHPRHIAPTFPFLKSLFTASFMHFRTSSAGASCKSVAFNPVVSTPANLLLASGPVPRKSTVASDSISSHTLPVLIIPNFSSGAIICRLVLTLASNMPVTGLRAALTLSCDLRIGTSGCFE